MPLRRWEELAFPDRAVFDVIRSASVIPDLGVYQRVALSAGCSMAPRGSKPSRFIVLKTPLRRVIKHLVWSC